MFHVANYMYQNTEKYRYIIPKNISKIDRCAFKKCLNLKEIIFNKYGL